MIFKVKVITQNLTKISWSWTPRNSIKYYYLERFILLSNWCFFIVENISFNLDNISFYRACKDPDNVSNIFTMALNPDYGLNSKRTQNLIDQC
jgi:hypothetical protein